MKHISNFIPNKEQLELIQKAFDLEQWTTEDEQKAYYAVLKQLTPTSLAVLADLLAERNKTK